MGKEKRGRIETSPRKTETLKFETLTKDVEKKLLHSGSMRCDHRGMTWKPHLPFAFSFYLGVALAAALLCVEAKAQEPSLDPYRACNHQCDAAAKGNALAQHTCFLAAYVRMNDPMAGGEDMEGIDACFGRLLSQLGDKPLAEALKLERPEIIAAVGRFLEKEKLANAPATKQLIQRVPKIVFPLDDTLHNDKPSPLRHRLYPEG
jgi:hypothetical protein